MLTVPMTWVGDVNITRAEQNRTNRDTHPVEIPVRVEPGAARKHRPQTLPFRLFGRRRARRVVGVDDVRTADDGVLGGLEEIGHVCVCVCVCLCLGRGGGRELFILYQTAVFIIFIFYFMILSGYSR